ncbi:MAG: amidoligase family protein [Candidatus Cloacimonetes bacterium]|nr:amidoligase family protein [Candidatus Cloacimonadota bacterium]
MKKIKCYGCQKLFAKNELNHFDDKMWCDDCLDEDTTICADCREERIYRDDATYTYDDYPICERCYDENYFYCEGCQRVYHYDQRSGDYCEECAQGEDTEGPEAMPDNKRYYCQSRRDLPVGVEIEAEGGDYQDVYYNLTPEGFGVSKDGSLDRGIEVQVPASNSGNTEKLIKQACSCLKENGFGVSKRCGLHIHIEFPSRKKTIKKLLLMAYACEPIFYAVNPQSRKCNGFCKSLVSAFKVSEILGSETKGIDKLFYSKANRKTSDYAVKLYKMNKWNDCRYFGFNLHSLFYQKTIEFRYHAGTTEPEKIISWVNLLKSILLYVRYSYQRSEVLTLIEQPTISAKIKCLSQMLKLNQPLANYFLKRYIRFNKKLCAV